MRSIRPTQWALSVVSGLLQVAVFPFAGPVPQWRAMLAWVALAPLLVALLQPGKDDRPLQIKDAALLGYACGLIWYLGTCYWIYQTMYLYGGIAKPVSIVILFLFAFYLGLYHSLFGALLALARRANLHPVWALVFAPVVWVASELARGRITGFPWDLYGNSQVDNLLLTRLAPVTGVMGLSFVLVAVNAGVAAVLLLRRRARLAVPAASLAFAALLVSGGALRGVREAGLAEGRTTAVLMQENLAVGAPGRETARPLTIAEELSTFVVNSQAPIGAKSPVGEVERPDLIIWPEAPSNFQSNDPYFQEMLSHLARRYGVPVIAGSLGVDANDAVTRGYSQYDSASLFSANGNYQGRYDKIHLVPWGEYVPYKQLFSFADRLTAGVGNMDPGHARTVFQTGGHSYGVFICYESIFGDEVREFVKNGAEVLVNISDDGWYGDTGAPWQHLNMARMRAIENHRWLLRDTNTGITTAIDPWGRMRWQAPRHVRNAFLFHFNFENGQTIYTRFGDWFAWLCALVTLVVCGMGARRQRVR